MPYKDLQKRREAFRAWHKNHPEKQAEYNRREKLKNPQRVRNRQNKAARTWVNRHPKQQMFNKAKCRAEKNNVPFKLKLEDIVIPERCPVFGFPLTWGLGSGTKNDSPSLDRIYPEKGYTKENVWVISWRANMIKNNATPEELMRLAVAVQEKVNAG